MKGINFFLLITLVACGSTQNENIQPMTGIYSKDRQYKQCYEESDSYKQAQVKPTGQVRIGFKLLSSGDIVDERIMESAFKDANLHACLLDITRQLKFLPNKTGNDRTMIKVLNFKTQTKIYDE